MRKFFLPLALLISACSVYEELPSDYDYSFKGKFRTYDTFAFFQEQSAQDDGTLFTKESIENVIAARMRSQGYSQRDKNPNLLVMYKIFYDSLSLTGYKQPELEEWIKYEDENIEYVERKYQLRMGTLYISFFDRKQKRTVWQGYATKVYGNDMFTNERLLRNAVRSVLNRYKVVSESFNKTIKERRF
jgi:hypothetical protein